MVRWNVLSKILNEGKMYILPDKNIYKKYIKGCSEKVRSYCILCLMNLPVLKSVIVTYDELNTFDEKEVAIKNYFHSSECMIRYLYKKSCNLIKNGGKLIPIAKDFFLNELEQNADFWVLEPSKREENIYCCNICLNRELENIHIEILGKGFDISDINKGKLCPHQIIDMPFPIQYGAYGEWWKWAHFHFCTQREYEQSILVRKNRLKEFGTKQEVEFEVEYKSIHLQFLKILFFYIEKIEESNIYRSESFYNLSCSWGKDGRIIFWDIQTPKGKLGAYLNF